ncbi:MAG TPA: c-type cytochrome [Candidatus Acidoferrales bacterium]|nr:c-type cytochrome [Candidatus Acidoferrales bacterium]
MKNFLLGIFFALVAIIAGAWFALKQGYVDFAADQRPSFIEARLSMAAVDASTDRRAPEQKNPVAATEDNIAAGAKLYLDHCAGCHGVPSNPDSQFAKSFYPAVPGFFHEAPDMSESANFYIIRHGIRWTGMPAWGNTLNDTQTWQVVTFLSDIEKLPPSARKVFGETTSTPATSMPMPSGMHMDH